MANANDTALLKSTIVVLATAFRDTIRRQLSDFIDGPYSEVPNEQAAKRTSFAPITNLSCEHHFGDLDSSQRGRPNASLHHPSTVQMLKRNRSNIVDWLEKLPDTERTTVFMNARVNGPLLRAQHRQQDSDVRKKIFDEAQQTAQPSHRATAKGNKKEKPNKNAQRQATLTRKDFTQVHILSLLYHTFKKVNVTMCKIQTKCSCFIVNSGSPRMLDI